MTYFLSENCYSCLYVPVVSVTSFNIELGIYLIGKLLTGFSIEHIFYREIITPCSVRNWFDLVYGV